MVPLQHWRNHSCEKSRSGLFFVLPLSQNLTDIDAILMTRTFDSLCRKRASSLRYSERHVPLSMTINMGRWQTAFVWYSLFSRRRACCLPKFKQGAISCLALIYWPLTCLCHSLTTSPSWSITGPVWSSVWSVAWARAPIASCRAFASTPRSSRAILIG